MSPTPHTPTQQPANRLFGPLWSTAGLLALAMPWLASHGAAAAASGWPVVNGLSAGLVGVFSALLWVHAAWRPDDTLSNAAAACFSGATALFSAGTISFPDAFAITSPAITARWGLAAYALGVVVVVTALVTVWGKWWQHR